MASLFPQTPWSLVAQAAGGQAERRAALQALLERYWQPVHNTIRFGWAVAEPEADGLVQRFLTALLRPEILARVDPDKTRFRDFLKAELRVFMATRDAAEKTAVDELRLMAPLPTPLPTPATSNDPDVVFDEQWLLLVFYRAIERLRANAGANAAALYGVFAARDLDGDVSPDATLAQKLAIDAGSIAPLLKEARRLFRRYVIAEVQQYTTDEAHARSELKWLLP